MTTINVNVNANQNLVVTVAGKEYLFEKNKSVVGKVENVDDLPFTLFEGIRKQIEENNWVSGYIIQEFDGKPAALIMSGTRAQMELGQESLVWFTSDVDEVESNVAQDATLLSQQGTISCYSAGGKKFCFDDTLAQKGAFIREDGLGVVLPASICHALSKPARMAVYKYQANTLMIEVYMAPRAWTDAVDGTWIIEGVEGINPPSH